MGKKGKKPTQTIEGGDLFKWLTIKKNRLMLFAAIEAVDDQEESFAHMSLLRGNGVDLKDNYCLAARVMKIHRAGSDLSIPQLNLKAALEIEEKYGERITRYITKKARERGGYFRFMNMTKSMVELLRRG